MSSENIQDIRAILQDNSKMEDFLHQRSQLCVAHAVKDKKGSFRTVIDMQSVIELLREVL